MRRLFALMLLPGASLAGEVPQLIGVEEWRAMVSGKTVEYSINGELFVREYYWPGRDVVTLEVVGEECFDARWEFLPETSSFCFHNGPTACFWHIRDGDRLYVQDADPGPHFGSTQQISAISDTVLSCAAAPVS